MTDEQKKDLMVLLWDHLPKDKEHKDRRRTGWGSKTQIGLIACIKRITAKESKT